MRCFDVTPFLRRTQYLIKQPLWNLKCLLLRPLMEYMRDYCSIINFEPVKRMNSMKLRTKYKHNAVLRTKYVRN
jgi:hypothetical protein